MKASYYIPVRFSRGEDSEEGWGRLLGLHGSGAKLLTRMSLHPKEEIFISFLLEGTSFESVRSRVSRLEKDGDDYWVGELQFVGMKERVDLNRILTDLSMRQR
ncbi:MAG: PilZ domain-containing protein [Elusimicrobia bacterium]|nr:PilZ domain-containing protein [Elusimicrobiota bacterium]